MAAHNLLLVVAAQPQLVERKKRKSFRRNQLEINGSKQMVRSLTTRVLSLSHVRAWFKFVMFPSTVPLPLAFCWTAARFPPLPPSPLATVRPRRSISSSVSLRVVRPPPAATSARPAATWCVPPPGGRPLAAKCFASRLATAALSPAALQNARTSRAALALADCGGRCGGARRESTDEPVETSEPAELERVGPGPMANDEPDKPPPEGRGRRVRLPKWGTPVGGGGGLPLLPVRGWPAPLPVRGRSTSGDDGGCWLPAPLALLLATASAAVFGRGTGPGGGSFPAHISSDVGGV